VKCAADAKLSRMVFDDDDAKKTIYNFPDVSSRRRDSIARCRFVTVGPNRIELKVI
jgi:hypothetical protein